MALWHRPGWTVWAKGVGRLFALTLLAGVAAALLAGIGTFRPAAVEQPIGFSHQRHLAPERLDGGCVFCHNRALNSAAAGRPTNVICLGCHQVLEPKTEDERRLLAYGQAGQEIPWRRVWRLPAHAFYSHQTHVSTAGIACTFCHGPIESADAPLSAPLKTLTMADCVDCHAAWPNHPAAPAGTVTAGTAAAAMPVTSDCNACHR